MATINQRLAFIISANAEQAVKAFEKTANTADKQMGKASKSIDKVGISLTKFGAAGLAAAGVIGSQLFKAGQSASDLSETMNKSAVVFGKGSKEIEKFGKQAADSLGLSQQAAVDAASTFAIFGKSAGLAGTDLTGFSKDLVTLSADFASFYNTSPEESILAIGAALRGEAEPIRKYGILLNDAVLKQEAQTMGIYDGNGALTAQQKVLAAQSAIMKQSSDAQGDFARTSDGLANSQRKLQANLENTKAALGEAILPVINAVTTGLNKSLTAFNTLNTSTGNAVGQFVAFGAVALGVVSSLSLVAGQTIKMRDRFVDADGQLNTFGKSARGVTVALGALAAASVAAEVIANVGNDGQKVEDRFNKLQITLADTGSTSKDVTTDFANLADRLKQTDKSGFGVGAMLKQVGKAIRVAGADTDAGRIAVEYLEQAFTDVSKSSPVAAQKVIDALLVEASAMDKTSAGYKDNTQLAARFQAQLNLLKGAQDANNKTLAEGLALGEKQVTLFSRYSTALPVVKDALQAAEDRAKKFAEKQREAAAAAEAFKNKVLGAADALKTKMNKALEAASANAKKAKDDFDAYVVSVSSFVSAGVSISSAQQTATENTKNLAAANAKVAETYNALQVARAAGDVEDIAAATLAWSEATKELGIAQQAPTSFLDVLRGQAADAAKFGENLLSLKGLGLSEAAFAQIAGAGAEAGNQIATSILSGADPAGKVAEINGLIAGTQKIADDVGKAAAATYKQSGVDLANALVEGVRETIAKYELKLQWKNLKKLKKPIKSIGDLTSAFAEDITGQFKLSGLEVPELAEGGIVKPRSGGTMVRLGEAGQSEAVIPLPSKGMGGSITINVSAGLGADGTEIGRLIVDELQAYQRRVGALPLKVS